MKIEIDNRNEPIPFLIRNLLNAEVVTGHAAKYKGRHSVIFFLIKIETEQREFKTLLIARLKMLKASTEFLYKVKTIWGCIHEARAE